MWPVMQKCTVVAKRELFFAWPFGLAAWLCGLIFINRMQSDRARDCLYKASNSIKSKNIKLWVFPEGTRRNTGQLHPFKKGAFHMAVDAQIPILPVVFSSYSTFLDDDNKRLDSGHVIISTLPPISTAGATKTDVEDLMHRTYNAMNQVYEMTSGEIAEEYEKSKPRQQARGKNALFMPMQNHPFFSGNRNENQLLQMNANMEFNVEHAVQALNHRSSAPPTAN